MSGHKTAGAGQPLHFKCAKARSTLYAYGRPGHKKIELTGRTRKVRRLRQALGQRMTMVSREYRCECGHVGWSRHIDLTYTERFT